MLAMPFDLPRSGLICATNGYAFPVGEGRQPGGCRPLPCRGLSVFPSAPRGFRMAPRVPEPSAVAATSTAVVVIVVAVVARPVAVAATAIIPAAAGGFGMTFGVAEPSAMTAPAVIIVIGPRAGRAAIIVVIVIARGSRTAIVAHEAAFRVTARRRPAAAAAIVVIVAAIAAATLPFVPAAAGGLGMTFRIAEPSAVSPAAIPVVVIVARRTGRPAVVVATVITG